MGFPELSTERLRLTAMSDKDTEQILELFSNPLVTEYYDLETLTGLDQASKIIRLFNARFEEELGIRWAIRLKNSDRLIGTCGFNSWTVTMRSAVIGYDLMPDYWNQGYMTEALKSIVHIAFSGELPCSTIHRIQADVVEGNTASCSVLANVGFKLEGIRRQSGYWKESYHDLKCFGLLSSDGYIP